MKYKKQTKDAQVEAVLIMLIDAKIEQLDNKRKGYTPTIKLVGIPAQLEALKREKDRILNDSEYLNCIIEDN